MCVILYMRHMLLKHASHTHMGMHVGKMILCCLTISVFFTLLDTLFKFFSLNIILWMAFYINIHRMDGWIDRYRTHRDLTTFFINGYIMFQSGWTRIYWTNPDNWFLISKEMLRKNEELLIGTEFEANYSLVAWWLLVDCFLEFSFWFSHRQPLFFPLFFPLPFLLTFSKSRWLILVKNSSKCLLKMSSP